MLVDGGTALFLASDILVASGGETLTLTTRAGTPGRIGLLAVRDVDGILLFVTLLVTTFDAAGSFELAGDVPSGLGGLDVGLQSFGQGPVRGTVASGLFRVMLN